MMIVSTAKYIRMSPRKLRPLAKSLRLMLVSQAEDRLGLLSDKGAKLILSAVKTAAHDAEINFKKVRDRLVIESVEVLEGFRLKRFQPVARGSAHGYKRRTSHIRVSLMEKSKEVAN